MFVVNKEAFANWSVLMDSASTCRPLMVECFLLQMLKAADPPMLQSSSVQLYPVVHKVLRLLAPRERRDMLPDLALLAPVVHVLSGEEAVRKMFEATLEIGCWWP